MITQIKRPGSQLSVTRLSASCMHFNIRVTDRDDGIMAEVAEDIDDEACVTVAPSLIQQPRIVFTGVSGAVMIKMKEVGRCLCFVAVS